MQNRLKLMLAVMLFFTTANVYAVTAGDNSSSDNSSRLTACYIEAILGGGAVGYTDTAMAGNIALSDTVFIPYGRLHLRFLEGLPFLPEISIADSGMFNFDRGGVKVGSSSTGYGAYYVKIPLMLTIPFFSYDSMFNFDAFYELLSTTATAKSDLLVNDAYIANGSKLSLHSSVMQFRLFLNTPIVSDPNIFAYSYAGIYYSEDYAPRTATPPATGGDRMLVETLIRHGGIFYEMKKDTPAKGLSFNVLVQVGYGWGFLSGRLNLTKPTFGNLASLLIFKGRGGLNYRYEFSNNFGISVDASVIYRLSTNFFTEANTAQYTASLGGDMIYSLTLNFLFGY